MFCKIHLVDKCLLLFMVILLLQSAYSLIPRNGVFSDSDHIDIIVRTSAAAIFGYFLSANFIRHASSPAEYQRTEAPQQINLTSGAEPEHQSDAPQNRIGFVPPDAPSPPEPGNLSSSVGPPGGSDESNANCLQIITAAGIGIFCLIVLILIRDFSGWNEAVSPSTTATVAQFRDFISGSVGFLIGSPTSGADGHR